MPARDTPKGRASYKWQLLTGAELRVMHALWSNGPLTPREVQDMIGANTKTYMNQSYDQMAMHLLRRLMKLGYVKKIVGNPDHFRRKPTRYKATTTLEATKAQHLALVAKQFESPFITLSNPGQSISGSEDRSEKDPE